MAETVTTAFEVVAASSTEKTDLITAFNGVNTAIDDAVTAGAFDARIGEQLKSEVVDVAEKVASNMTEHS